MKTTTVMTIALALFTFAAIAGIKVTPKPGLWNDGTADYASEEACIAAAKAALVDEMPIACHRLDRVIVVGDCSDVPKPAGFVPTLTSHACPGETDALWLSETRLVPAPYPGCWAIADVQTTQCPAVP